MKDFMEEGCDWPANCAFPDCGCPAAYGQPPMGPTPNVEIRPATGPGDHKCVPGPDAVVGGDPWIRYFCRICQQEMADGQLCWLCEGKGETPSVQTTYGRLPIPCPLCNTDGEGS